MLVFFVLAFAGHLRHLRHGGFYMDDWSNAAWTHHPAGGGGFLGAIRMYADFTDDRPLLIPYMPLLHNALGEHMHLHLAWVTFLAALMSAALYVVLRQVGVASLHAGVISALALLFPFSDSPRLWSTAGVVYVAVIAYLVGLAWSLRLLRRAAPARAHAGPLLLYAASALSYEVCLAAIAISGLLYPLVARRRAARRRWAADLVVCAVVGAWVLTHTKHKSIPLADQVDHARAIISAGAQILAFAAMPTTAAPGRALPLLVIGVVLALGLASRLALPPRDPWRLQLGRWLLLAAGGVGVAAAGWVMFVPADPYYTPFPVGMANRVNVVAGVGLVMLLYATVGTLATLSATALRSRSAAWGLAPVACGLLLLGGYTRTLNDHMRTWDAAFAAESSVIGQLKTVAPRPPAGALLITFGEANYQALGVPIFAASWDLDGAVKMAYNRADVGAYPMLPTSRIVCRAATALAQEGPTQQTSPTSYGRVVFIDVPSGRVARPGSRGACRRALTSFAPGPVVAGG